VTGAGVHLFRRRRRGARSCVRRGCPPVQEKG